MQLKDKARNEGEEEVRACGASVIHSRIPMMWQTFVQVRKMMMGLNGLGAIAWLERRFADAAGHYSKVLLCLVEC